MYKMISFLVFNQNMLINRQIHKYLSIFVLHGHHIQLVSSFRRSFPVIFTIRSIFESQCQFLFILRDNSKNPQVTVKQINRFIGTEVQDLFVELNWAMSLPVKTHYKQEHQLSGTRQWRLELHSFVHAIRRRPTFWGERKSILCNGRVSQIW